MSSCSKCDVGGSNVCISCYVKGKRGYNDEPICSRCGVESIQNMEAMEIPDKIVPCAKDCENRQHRSLNKSN